MLASDACADGNRREILRAGFAHHRTRRHEAGKGSGDVLVGNIDLLFQRIQLGIAENLPPIAMKRGVLRLRDFPAVHFLEIVGSDFLERCRHSRDGGAIVFRADVAALQKDRAAKKRGRNTHLVRCLHRCLRLLAS